MSCVKVSWGASPRKEDTMPRKLGGPKPRDGANLAHCPGLGVPVEQFCRCKCGCGACFIFAAGYRATNFSSFDRGSR